MYHQYSGIPKEELQFQWGEDLFSVLEEQKTADLVVQDGSLNFLTHKCLAVRNPFLAVSWVWMKGATKVFKLKLLKNLTAVLNTNSPVFTLQQTLLSSPTIHVVQPGGSSPPAMCVESLRSEKSELSTSNLH